MNHAQIDRIADALADTIICTCGHQHKPFADDGHIDKRVRVRPGFFARRARRTAKHERKIKAVLRSVWDDERQTMVSNLRKLGKTAHLKFGLSIIDLILYPQGAATKKLAKELREAAKSAMEEMGSAAGEEAGLDMAFDVTNPRVTTWLDGYALELSENLETVSESEIRKRLAAGIEEGEGIPDLTARINDLFKEWEAYRAEMIARTETIRASNQAAIEAYKQSGVVEKKTWLPGPDSCEACVAIGLQDPIPLEDEFESEEFDDVMAPPLHPNCLLPGTRVIAAGDRIAGLRARYDGEAIELTFANGTRLSVTPNHLLLTPHGFAAANLLRKGDDVFYCPDLERIIPVDPDNNGEPSLIEEIVRALAETSGMQLRRVPIAPEYLHGDGRLMNGYIDVIGANGLLGGTDQSVRPEHVDGQNLNATDTEAASLTGAGGLASMFKRLALSADSIMGGLRVSSPFFRREPGLPDKHGFPLPPRLNAVSQDNSPDGPSVNAHSLTDGLFRSPAAIHGADTLRVEGRTQMGLAEGCQPGPFESMCNGVAGNAKAPSNFPHGSTGLIQAIQIMDIQRYHFTGHVYDLQTSSSLYIANGVVSSNCVCACAAFIEE